MYFGWPQYQVGGGAVFVPTVLLTIIAEQLFDIMPILLRERMTSC